MTIDLIADDDPNFRVPPKEVIEGIAGEDVKQVLVIGKLADGELYVASSHNTEVTRSLINEFISGLESGAYSA